MTIHRGTKRRRPYTGGHIEQDDVLGDKKSMTYRREK